MHLDGGVIFENLHQGAVTHSTKGLHAFRQQAEEAKTYFSQRKQTIMQIIHEEDESTVVISYHAILAMDFPNGMKIGDELTLTGRSVFKFLDEKIIQITDIS